MTMHHPWRLATRLSKDDSPARSSYVVSNGLRNILTSSVIPWSGSCPHGLHANHDPVCSRPEIDASRTVLGCDNRRGPCMRRVGRGLAVFPVRRCYVDDPAFFIEVEFDRYGLLGCIHVYPSVFALSMAFPSPGSAGCSAAC